VSLEERAATVEGKSWLGWWSMIFLSYFIAPDKRNPTKLAAQDVTVLE
jgi:hypothetical protein